MASRDCRSLIGLALDLRRLDFLTRVVKSAGDDANKLLAEAMTLLFHGLSRYDVKYRTEALAELVRLFSELPNPDYVSMVNCYIQQKAPIPVATVLDKLLAKKNHEKSELTAYQIAFDLYENASQEFIRGVVDALNKEKNNRPALQDSEGGATQEDSDTNPSARTPHERLLDILHGTETIRLHQQFLIHNKHADMLILKEMREAARTAVAHNGVILANGFMHMGTTCDNFLRNNLEWVGKATNWNKFCALSTLGLIHRGNESSSMRLLELYLPKPDAQPSEFGFKEGGALFALGLMHANHGNPEVVRYLREQLTSATTQHARHGAALGIGLAAMGTGDQESYAVLRDNLFVDDPVAGEGCGLAMGLVKVGSRDDEAFKEMTQYMEETAHDKIQRGLRTGVALLAYGRTDEATLWADRLAEYEHNSVMRQTCVGVLAMAWVGSGNAAIAQRLLNYVAADPIDDVKRAAAIAIGFVYSNDPATCVSIVNMLSSHYNPHVRYGAAMALGIACAGTGYSEAIEVLEPMLVAKENFVRQGAAIALSFVLVQHTEPTCPKVVEFRKKLTTMIADRMEDPIVKFGACMAQGILDVGGRNMTLSLHSRSGQPDMDAVVGMFVFMQYWNFHPWAPFISLACRPTCLIALNRRLDMPKMDFRCDAKRSLYDYPPDIVPKKANNLEKVELAVLSITNKRKPTKDSQMTAADKSRTSRGPEKMEVDDSASPAVAAVVTTTADADAKPPTAVQPPEPSFHLIANPARAVRLQLKSIADIDELRRYRPIKSFKNGGIVMVQDRHPKEVARLWRDLQLSLQPEKLVETARTGGTMTVVAHRPFEFDLENV